MAWYEGAKVLLLMAQRLLFAELPKKISYRRTVPPFTTPWMYDGTVLPPPQSAIQEKSSATQPRITKAQASSLGSQDLERLNWPQPILICLLSNHSDRMSEYTCLKHSKIL